MIVLWTHRWTGWGWGRGQALKPQLEGLRGSIFGTHSTPDLSFPDPSTLSSPLHTKGALCGSASRGNASLYHCLPSPEPWHGQHPTRCGRQERRGWAPDRSQRAEGSTSLARPPPLLPSHQPSPQIPPACSFLSLPVPLPWPFYQKPLLSVSSFSPSVLLLLGCRVRGT